MWLSCGFKAYPVQRAAAAAPRPGPLAGLLLLLLLACNSQAVPIDTATPDASPIDAGLTPSPSHLELFPGEGFLSPVPAPAPDTPPEPIADLYSPEAEPMIPEPLPAPDSPAGESADTPQLEPETVTCPAVPNSPHDKARRDEEGCGWHKPYCAEDLFDNPFRMNLNDPARLTWLDSYVVRAGIDLEVYCDTKETLHKLADRLAAERVNDIKKQGWNTTRESALADVARVTCQASCQEQCKRKGEQGPVCFDADGESFYTDHDDSSEDNHSLCAEFCFSDRNTIYAKRHPSKSAAAAPEHVAPYCIMACGIAVLFALARMW